MRITITDDFDLDKIYLSGQCFRVRRYDDGGFRFLSGANVLYIRKDSKDKYAVSCDKGEWSRIWLPYFDLGRDYKELLRAEHGKSDFADQAMEFGKGIRVLCQDPWETLVTFLISQRKNIPAITKAVEALSDTCGHTVITEYETLFAFPTPEELFLASEDDLRNCGLGYRTPYVLDAAARVFRGTLNLARLSSCGDEELLGELLSVHGVGKKVANCVALFAYSRTSCVPVDVWIERAIEEDCRGISPFPLYGENAGIIQQYIFFYERFREKG